MPNLGVPLVNRDGTAGLVWYRFFVSLFNAALAGNIDPATGNPVSNPAGTTLSSVAQGLSDETANRIGADAGLQTQINSLQTQNSTLSNRVSVLEAKVAQLQAQLDAVDFGPTSPTATAGAGGPLPLQVSTYLTLTVGATPYRLPMYNP